MTMQTLDSSVAAAQISDRRAAAAAVRAARRAATSPVAGASGEHVVLRRARREDELVLDRLAALDGARRPAGELLLAEVDGEVLAAVPVEGGRAIADPFRPTADLVEQLHARTRLLGGRGPRARRRLRPRLRLRVAA
jgi:hypothetical protein